MKKQAFHRIKPSDSEIITILSKNSSVTSRLKHFPDFKGQTQYWIDAEMKKPHLLLVLTLMQKSSSAQLMPWMEEEGTTYLLEIIPLLSPTPEALAGFFTSFVEKCTLLAVPDVKDQSTIDLLEQAGFKRVGSIIKGQGFFKGTPHHVMRRG